MLHFNIYFWTYLAFKSTVYIFIQAKAYMRLKYHTHRAAKLKLVIIYTAYTRR